ncbi:MAG: lysostaphin resistance A-like protein [Dehalococcoidia bacterium]
MNKFTNNQDNRISPQKQFISNARKGITNWKYWLISILSVFLIWQGIGIIPSLLTCLLINNYEITGFNCNTDNFIIAGPSYIPNFILAFVPFVLALITLYVVVTRLHQKPFISIITGRQQFDFRRLFFAMSIVAIFSVISLLIQLSGSQSEDSTMTFNSPGFEFFIIVILALMLVPIQAGMEEIFFRGYILQAFSLIAKSKYFLIISTSSLFAILHIANPEPWEYGIVAYLSSVLILAIFMSLITVLDGGLELAIGFHIMNNLWAFLIVNLEKSVVPTPALFIADIPEFNLFTLILPSLIQFLIFGSIFAWKYKWFRKNN